MQTNNPIHVRDKVKQFIEQTGADNVVDEIRNKLNAGNNGKMPALSDLVDDAGNQYVNYIQQGGGVLGVALVGYTYVLEKLGVRFSKVAGTSAGAINTLMLAAIDPKNYRDDEGKPLGYKLQSEAILHEMLSYDFWDFVDSSSLVKGIIKNYLKSTNYISRILSNATIVLIAAIVLSFAACFFYIPPFNNWLTDYPLLKKILTIGAVIAIIAFLFMAVIFIIARTMVARFSKSNYGINTGNNFLEWITGILKKNGISTTEDLERSMIARVPPLRLRQDTGRPQSTNPEDNTPNITGPRVKFITSDIVNQTKVEFPDDSCNYWLEPDKENPAVYVRASMAIPVFFEPLIVNIEQVIKQRVQELEEKELRTDVSEIYFVDGGTLSNFPINAFFNPGIIIPRAPTFGAKLEDSTHIASDRISNRKLKFSEFSGNILNTIRGYYDKDFISRNKIYKKGIAYIDVAGHNWLNFNISEAEQAELFKKGVEAAKVFFFGGKIWDKGVPRYFNKYDWFEFRDARTQLLKGEEVETTPATATPYSLSISEEMQEKA